jgi:omega-amidase
MKLRVVMAYDASTLQSALPHADVVVLPELMSGGYAALKRGEGIHALGDDFLENIRVMSKRNRCTYVAGSVPIVGRNKALTNTSLVFRHGIRVHRYDKIHLFRPGGELKYFKAGGGNHVFSLTKGSSRIRAGLIICYDLRFPELARMLAAGGMQILFVPARWPEVRDETWLTLLKARAIENQVFVVGCNARGREGGFSYVFDPLGRLIMSSREDPLAPFHNVVLDLALLREAHSFHRNLRDAVLLRQVRFPRRLTAGNSRDATV